MYPAFVFYGIDGCVALLYDWIIFQLLSSGKLREFSNTFYSDG